MNSYGGYKCLACGDWHPGSGNLPCPKQVPMATASHDVNDLSNRDLLWLAAWAAGIEDGLLLGSADSRGGVYWDADELGIHVHENHPAMKMPSGKMCFTRMRQGGHGWLWNPLDDDGDAYRLAAHLKVGIDFKSLFAWHRTDANVLSIENFAEEAGGDRLAIVRMAVRVFARRRQ